MPSRWDACTLVAIQRRSTGAVQRGVQATQGARHAERTSTDRCTTRRRARMTQRARFQKEEGDRWMKLVKLTLLVGAVAALVSVLAIVWPVNAQGTTTATGSRTFVARLN